MLPGWPRLGGDGRLALCHPLPRDGDQAHCPELPPPICVRRYAYDTPAHQFFGVCVRQENVLLSEWQGADMRLARSSVVTTPLPDLAVCADVSCDCQWTCVVSSRPLLQITLCVTRVSCWNPVISFSSSCRDSQSSCYPSMISRWAPAVSRSRCVFVCVSVCCMLLHSNFSIYIIVTGLKIEQWSTKCWRITEWAV